MSHNRYTGIIVFLGILLFLAVFSFKWNTPSNQYYNASGLMPTPIKHWIGTISASSATQTVDISSAGFANVFLVNITSQDNTGTVSTVPFASVKTVSTTSLTINIVNNSTILSILSLNVSNAAFPTSTAGMTLNVECIGN